MLGRLLFSVAILLTCSQVSLGSVQGQGKGKLLSFINKLQSDKLLQLEKAVYSFGKDRSLQTEPTSEFLSTFQECFQDIDLENILESSGEVDKDDISEIVQCMQDKIKESINTCLNNFPLVGNFVNCLSQQELDPDKLSEESGKESSTDVDSDAIASIDGLNLADMDEAQCIETFGNNGNIETPACLVLLQDPDEIKSFLDELEKGFPNLENDDCALLKGIAQGDGVKAPGDDLQDSEQVIEQITDSFEKCNPDDKLGINEALKEQGFKSNDNGNSAQIQSLSMVCLSLIFTVQLLIAF